jgi:endonuclease/exonuclease/phosphatase family metal-dependent hydrolase
MKLVSFNIQYSLGRDGRYDLARQMDVVREADVICLQEVERHWRRTGMADQPAVIEALLPDRYAAFGPGIDVDASLRDGDRILNRRRQFGNMTLSRWPILSVRNLLLPKLDTGDDFNCLTTALETVIAAPEGHLRVINIHLSHVTAGERLLQLDDLARILSRSVKEGGVWNGTDSEGEDWQSDDPRPSMPSEMLLAGDFNAEPDWPEIRRVTAPVDQGGLGLLDCWIATGNPPDQGVTFFKDEAQGVFADQRIDFVFASHAFSLRLRHCWIDEATRVSDHQPVWVELAAV